MIMKERPQLGAEETGGIGSDAVKGRVAQGQQSGGSGDQVHAHRQNHEDEGHVGYLVEVGGAQALQQNRQNDE